MNRRQFASTLGAAVAGIVAGKALLADDKPAAAKDAAKDHACAGKNDCKGKGGCKTADHECAGKNDCKGKGGCASPAKKKADKAAAPAKS